MYIGPRKKNQIQSHYALFTLSRHNWGDSWLLPTTFAQCRSYQLIFWIKLRYSVIVVIVVDRLVCVSVCFVVLFLFCFWSTEIPKKTQGRYTDTYSIKNRSDDTTCSKTCKTNYRSKNALKRPQHFNTWYQYSIGFHLQQVSAEQKKKSEFQRTDEYFFDNSDSFDFV